MSPTVKLSILAHIYSGLACVGLRIQGTCMQNFVFDCLTFNVLAFKRP